MAVSLGTSSSAGGSTHGATEVIPIPASPAANDIAVVGLRRWETGIDPAVTGIPAGFTEISLANRALNSVKLNCFWARMAGGESGNWTFSWTGNMWSTGMAVLVTGALTSGSPVADSNSAVATSATVPSTSVTATDPFLAHFVVNDGNSATPPTGFTELFDIAEMKMSYRIPGGAGSHAASGGTLSGSEDMAVALIAVGPQVGPPPEGPHNTNALPFMGKSYY